jgi:hypothetical protein
LLLERTVKNNALFSQLVKARPRKGLRRRCEWFVLKHAVPQKRKAAFVSEGRRTKFFKQ